MKLRSTKGLGAIGQTYVPEWEVWNTSRMDSSLASSGITWLRPAVSEVASCDEAAWSGEVAATAQRCGFTDTGCSGRLQASLLTHGVGPLWFEGPVQGHSSNPPRAGPGHFQRGSRAAKSLPDVSSASRPDPSQRPVQYPRLHCLSLYWPDSQFSVWSLQEQRPVTENQWQSPPLLH